MSVALATENGATNWALGVQTIAPAILPPSGATEYYDYFLYYSANSFKNSTGQSSVPGFKLNAEANAGRVVHTWKTDSGPWGFSSGVIVAGDNNDLAVTGAHQTRAGLNYAYLTPLYVTYNTEQLHLLFGPSVFIPTPTGGFNPSNLVNASTNYVTYNQEMAVTYFVTPRLEVSTEAVLSINATNPGNNYHSGTVLDFDFAVNYAPLDSMPNLFFGFNGFAARQLTNDSQNGNIVGDGNRLETNGLGVQAIYYVNKATAVALKYQHEVAVKNGPQGDRYWLEFALPLPF